MTVRPVPATTLAEAFAQAAALDAPLNVRLAAYATASRPIVPAIATAYDRLVARLLSIDSEAVGPRVGDVMPSFLLPDQTGHFTRLEDLTVAGLVVVSFNRGHWCPYCRMELLALAAISPAVVAAGGRIVSIVPEREQYSTRMIRERALPFSVLSDIDLDYTFALGLKIWVGEELPALYRERGLDLATYHGNCGDFLPIPATFVVDRDGCVTSRFIDPEFRRRMEPDAIITAVRAAASR